MGSDFGDRIKAPPVVQKISDGADPSDTRDVGSGFDG